VDKERGRRNRRARSPGPFSAESWGYSAFQYIMARAGPKKESESMPDSLISEIADLEH
jgi:hypothetical protein